MNKDEKIAYIRKVIDEWGGFTTAEVEAESSPMYNSMGKDNNALIERFNLNDVEVVNYVHETEVDSFNVPYDELDEDMLDEIVILTENYEADMLQTEERCSN